MGDFLTGQPERAKDAAAPSLPQATTPLNHPTPDYGNLGPSSDIAAYSLHANGKSSPTRRSSRLSTVLALAIGMSAALLAHNMGRLQSATARPLSHFFEAWHPTPSAKDIRQLDRLGPQKQAEALLEQAVGHSSGAIEQISFRAEGWQGKVRWTPQIATLTTAALNSDDMHVRESGVEVELAAYGIAKNQASLTYVLKMAQSSDHAQKIWGLWVLGLLGNRGVDTAQVVGVLAEHLKDADAESRQWAVEALALTGADETIDLLLKTMHDDPSAKVRERAACGIAASGLFTEQQRARAIPQLLNDLMIPRSTRKPMGGRSKRSETSLISGCRTIPQYGGVGTKPTESSRG